jgi:hypothetical protein
VHWNIQADHIVSTTEQELSRSSFMIVLWRKLELPFTEIVVHLIVTLLSILSIASIEFMLRLVGLSGKQIPLTKVPVDEWMFFLEILAATLIISIGLVKAVIALVWS